MHRSIYLTILYLTFLPSLLASDNLKITTNSSAEGSKYTIYNDDHVYPHWSAINAECSTCHPANIIQEGSGPASRVFYITNSAEAAVPASVKTVVADSFADKILAATVDSSEGLGEIRAGETKSFQVHYNCKNEEIVEQNLNGWTLVRVVLTLETGQAIEFSYQKICTTETVPKFDFSLVILMVIAILIVAIGTRHTHTLFANQAQQADEVRPLHAVFFIVFASAMLLVFYFLKDYILGVVTVMVSMTSLTSTSIIINQFIEGHASSSRVLMKKFRVPVMEEVTVANIVSFFIAFGLVLAWFITRNWVLNNIIGTCVVLLVLKVVRISSMKVALILLGLAFLYDIFWVFISKPIFGSSVMATVASSIDLPLKLEWPRLREYPIQGCGMLGLGDMVLPGLFVAYCYRFDQAKFLRLFYRAAILGYAVGLAICGFFLVVLGIAQPALLYLVPTTMGFVTIVAHRNRYLRDIWEGLPTDDPNDNNLISSEDDKPVADAPADVSAEGTLHLPNMA